MSYCHFSSFKAPSITEPRTKCARCETPLIQHFFKNFWSSFNAEFYPESKSVRISKIRPILTILQIFFIHILRTYICREETNFSMKQLLNFNTYWLIYYFNYWNLKFMIDSFFVSFKNFLFPSVQVIEKHGMIVSIENVKVNTYFVITYSLILRKKVFLTILNSPRIKKIALVFSYNSTFSALQEHCWVRLCPALWTKSWIQGVKF